MEAADTHWKELPFPAQKPGPSGLVPSPHTWAVVVPAGFGVSGLHPLLDTDHTGEGSPMGPVLTSFSSLIPMWTLGLGPASWVVPSLPSHLLSTVHTALSQQGGPGTSHEAWPSLGYSVPKPAH